MRRSRSPFLASALVFALLGCGSDSTAGPPNDDASYVLAYTMESDTACSFVKAKVDGTNRPLTSTCGVGVTWSPDGRRLAFGKAPVDNPTLWIVNADGSGERAVPNGAGLGHPDWSPDGTRIAATDQATATFAILRPDGTQRVDFPGTFPGGTGRPSWSRNGSALLFTTADTIRAIDVSTQVITNVAVPSAHFVFAPRWSPDGTRIAFVARTDRFNGIYVVNADGSNEHLIVDGFIQSEAVWSPDGQKVVYAAAITGGLPIDIYIASSDGTGTPQNLTNNASSHFSLRPDWARMR